MQILYEINNALKGQFGSVLLKFVVGIKSIVLDFELKCFFYTRESRNADYLGDIFSRLQTLLIEQGFFRTVKQSNVFKKNIRSW